MSKKTDKNIIENILKQDNVLYDSEFSIFSRFIVRVKNSKSDIPVGIGCIFSNSKVVLYQPSVDIMATYPCLELFEAEFNSNYGYDVTFLDKAIPNLYNKKIN